MSNNDEQIDRFVAKVTAGFVARQREAEVSNAVHMEDSQLVSPGPFASSYIEGGLPGKGRGR